MSIPYQDREKYIKTLFDYEVQNNIPENQRLTYDPFADCAEVIGPSPQKKAYVDIRQIIREVKDLKHSGLL